MLFVFALFDVFVVYTFVRVCLAFEANAYWDFRALVNNDNQTLSPDRTLLFLRVIHGDSFSAAHWETFQVGWIQTCYLSCCIESAI